ncbi:hypothetical protein MELE44368_05095 [Mycolicibacterium elephantis DSM 44368]|uniref:Uncharacterized protein n=1 Tax=Mycolicibacterium elephantis DSM 44368 TaxID=1335622 RepID=A0A439DPI0_9MYCO|nr:hypothetical protein MELE44368_05095 [Mycolicibacterium elephantis DSM 44368]
MVTERLAVICTAQFSQMLPSGEDDAGVSGLASTTGDCAVNLGVVPRCSSAG